MSPKAIADPEDIERFAGELRQFNAQMRELSQRMNGRLQQLNSSWQDQEFQKFAQQFEQTMKGIHNFTNACDAFVPGLQKKAQFLREYLNRR
jgi:uncharacterized protein YukE